MLLAARKPSNCNVSVAKLCSFKPVFAPKAEQLKLLFALFQNSSSYWTDNEPWLEHLGSLIKIGEGRIQTQDLSVITITCHPQDRHHDPPFLEFAFLKILFWKNWGSIRWKHVVRGQNLSQIKARLLWQVENVLSLIKTQQPTSGDQCCHLHADGTSIWKNKIIFWNWTFSVLRWGDAWRCCRCAASARCCRQSPPTTSSPASTSTSSPSTPVASFSPTTNRRTTPRRRCRNSFPVSAEVWRNRSLPESKPPQLKRKF